MLRTSRLVAPAGVSHRCGAIEQSLLGSELFGHIEGAFTSAIARRGGAFHAARGGTLFLDEIGNLEKAMQRKLLRALARHGGYKPLGCDKERPVECRIVAASNIPLTILVATGLFLPDLYHRLDILHIDVPPLRERVEDIAIILTAFAAERGIHLEELEASVLELLRAARWPGNVRDLERGVARLGALASEHLEATPRLTPELVRLAWPELAPAHADRFAPIAEVFRKTLITGPCPGLARTIRPTLDDVALEVGGSPKRAAELLGDSYDAFQVRRKRHG